MEKYRRFYGIFALLGGAALLIYIGFALISPQAEAWVSVKEQLVRKEADLEKKQNQVQIVKSKIKKIKDSIVGAQKKVYYPEESDLGNDSLFFTLYNDVIEMIHANSVRIKSIDYTYNPEEDAFVKFGKDVYFVCDINLEVVSNYVNLGKLIESIYQYPYYIKINQIEVKPYEKDKKVLVSKLSLRLYAHTSPDENSEKKI